MKIIHTSDLHLDSPLTSRLSSDKVRARKRELLGSFRRTVEFAKSEGARGYIISGDLFDAEKASRETVDNFLYTVRSAPEITFFYLHGNHERSLLSECGATIPENLKLFSDDWTYYTLGETVIVGRCETAAGMFSTLSLDKDKRNILVLHGELCDRSDTDGRIGKKELSDLPIDYIALGHYHTYSETVLSPRTTAVYCGTPEGRGFDEAGDKGVVLLSSDEDKISHRFVKTALRATRIIDVNISTATCHAEIEDLVDRATKDTERSDLIRARLIGERSIYYKPNLDLINDRFKDRFYYFEAKDGTRARISADDFKLDRSLKGEFIRGVIADETLTDTERAMIIETGIAALLGEEIE